MERDWSSIKELPNGWWNYEHLDEETEKLNEILETYILKVENKGIWVATLSPSRQRKPSAVLGEIINAMPADKRKSAESVLNDSINRTLEPEYICEISTSFVQNCVEKLVSNVKSGQTYERIDTYRGPGGCLVRPISDANGTDTMGLYLMEGTLYGGKKDGEIVLKTQHPSLPNFSAEGKSFRQTYDTLVGKIKSDLDDEQIWSSSNGDQNIIEKVGMLFHKIKSDLKDKPSYAPRE